MPPPRPPSGPDWPLTTGVSETYWASPGLEMAVKDEGGEVTFTALAAACSAGKRATWVLKVKSRVLVDVKARAPPQQVSRSNVRIRVKASDLKRGSIGGALSFFILYSLCFLD